MLMPIESILRYVLSLVQGKAHGYSFLHARSSSQQGLEIAVGCELNRTHPFIRANDRRLHQHIHTSNARQKRTDREFWATGPELGIRCDFTHNLGQSLRFHEMMRKGGDTGGLLGALNLGLRYCAIIGQVPELHPWLIGNNTVMSILSKFQRFPNPTAIILQEAEIRLDSHSQEYHICGNSLLCKLATNHRLTKYGSRNTDSINLLFEIL